MPNSNIYISRRSSCHVREQLSRTARQASPESPHRPRSKPHISSSPRKAAGWPSSRPPHPVDYHLGKARPAMKRKVRVSINQRASKQASKTRHEEPVIKRSFDHHKSNQASRQGLSKRRPSITKKTNRQGLSYRGPSIKMKASKTCPEEVHRSRTNTHKQARSIALPSSCYNLVDVYACVCVAKWLEPEIHGYIIMFLKQLRLAIRGPSIITKASKRVSEPARSLTSSQARKQASQ